MRDDGLPRLLRRLTAGSVPRITDQFRADLASITVERGRDLAEMARAHRVAGWAAAALQQDADLTGAPQFAPLREAAVSQTVGSLALYGELSRLLRTFGDKGVQTVVLKGPHIAASYYPEPGLRSYGDLDVLIRERDLPAVSAILEEDGYTDSIAEGPHRLHSCHGLFQRIYKRTSPPACVEVHCDHLQIGLEPLTLDDVWRRSIPMKFGLGEARVLAPNDLFVQLCVHLHRHGFNRLIWFKDLDLIVRRGCVDWDAVAELAQKEGCESSVGYALQLLHRMLGTPLPDGASALVNLVPTIERWLFESAWPSAGVVQLRPSWRLRWRRAVQFAPETGLVRGGLASLPFIGRRKDKLRVLGTVIK